MGDSEPLSPGLPVGSIFLFALAERRLGWGTPSPRAVWDSRDVTARGAAAGTCAGSALDRASRCHVWPPHPDTPAWPQEPRSDPVWRWRPRVVAPFLGSLNGAGA